jgi:hypothetical protein
LIACESSACFFGFAAAVVPASDTSITLASGKSFLRSLSAVWAAFLSANWPE